VSHEGPRESKGALAEELALFGAEDPVSVAAGHEQKVSEAPAVVSVVSGDHIQKTGARTLADVLKTLPGFETSRDVQGYHHIAIRGLHNDSEVLLLYDGHRLNNPYDAKALWELPAQAIERVEVIRGPASALYGAGAFMGVVNVLPRRHDGVAVTAGGGWFSGAPAGADAPWDGEAHLAAGIKVAELVGLHLDGDVVRSAGSSRAVATDGITGTLRATNGPDGSPLLAKDAPAGFTNDRQLFVNVGGAVRFDLKEGTDAGLDARFLRQQRGALIGLFDTVGPAGQLTWQTLLVGAHGNVKFGENTVGARFHFDTQSVDNVFQLAPRGYPSSGGNFFTDGVFEEFQYGTRSLGGEVSFERSLFEGNRISVGLQASQDALTSYDDLSNVGFDSSGKLIDLHANQPPNFSGCKPNPPDTACQLPQKFLQPRLTLGALVQDEWRVGSIGITAGVRYDRYTQTLADTRQPIQASTAPPLTANTGDAFSPRLGLVWAAAEGLTVKGLFASAYRAPTFQELSDYVVPVGSFATGRFAGAPDLRPVHIYSGDLAAEYLFKTDPARIRLRGNGFYERVTDPIVAVDTTGNSNQPYQNRGEQGVQVFGTEVEGRAEFGPRHYVYVNLTWFRAQDDAAPAGFNLLTDVPQYKMHWGLVLGLGSFLDFSAQTTLAAERRNDSRTVLESLRFWRIPAYALVDAALQTQPIAVGPGTVGAAIVVRNIFDYDYRDTPFRPDRIPGLIPLSTRSGFLELRAKF
jgi:outer membrane receptor protein involved in Fe transport